MPTSHFHAFALSVSRSDLCRGAHMQACRLVGSLQQCLADFDWASSTSPSQAAADIAVAVSASASASFWPAYHEDTGHAGMYAPQYKLADPSSADSETVHQCFHIQVL